jgi:endo-1,4-beta-xylanase
MTSRTHAPVVGILAVFLVSCGRPKSPTKMQTSRYEADLGGPARAGNRVVIDTNGVHPTASAASAEKSQSRESHQSPASLRQAASTHNLLIGSMVRAPNLSRSDDSLHSGVIRREFSILTAPCYFWTVHPTRTTFDFRACDAIFAFGKANRIPVRGHTLIWWNAIPEWVSALETDALLEEARRYLTTVVERYRGSAVAWDVVNEAVKPGDPMVSGLQYRSRDLWLTRLGPAIFDSAFFWARRADPDAKLFYNDHSIEESPQWGETIYRLVAGMKKRGVPIDGVGLQFHLRAGQRLDTARIRSDMDRIAALGLDIHITELDVLTGRSPATPQELRAQADTYRAVLRICLSVRRCTAVVFWGFTDRYQNRSTVTWADDPLILDRNYQPKPAYSALMEDLKLPWHR